MENTKIKPCPFCGTKNVKIKDNHSGAYWVLCPECGCQLYCERSVEEAVDLWNARTPII